MDIISKYIFIYFVQSFLREKEKQQGDNLRITKEYFIYLSIVCY